MAIHRFTFQPRRSAPVPSVEPKPSISQKLPQKPDRNRREEITHDPTNVHVEDVRELNVRGFRFIDEAIKSWLSEMFSIIPTKDGIKPAQVRVSGGHKEYLIYRQDIRSGRISLPAVALNRTGAKINIDKFSPPAHYMKLKYSTRSRNTVAQVYRPVPYLIDYEVQWWTEFKRDAEYMLYELVPRFNPLAEITIEDESLRGQLTMRPGEYRDNSDIEAEVAKKDFTRYDYSFSAEGWLPLPEKITPTVLGDVVSVEIIKNLDSFQLGVNNMGEFDLEPIVF